jgi:hypothetical protein
VFSVTSLSIRNADSIKGFFREFPFSSPGESPMQRSRADTFDGCFGLSGRGQRRVRFADHCILRADEKLTAFLELQSAIRHYGELS